MGIIKKVVVNCYQCKKELLRCIYRENAICFSCKQENKKAKSKQHIKIKKGIV